MTGNGRQMTKTDREPTLVMPGLEPGIHVSGPVRCHDVGGRDNPRIKFGDGHDGCVDGPDAVHSHSPLPTP